MHFFTVWAAVYLTFGLGVRPTWRSYRFTLATTASGRSTVIGFNAVTGTTTAPEPQARRGHLPMVRARPGYVVVEIALVAGIWALLTWPWTRTAEPVSANEATDRAGATRTGVGRRDLGSRFGVRTVPGAATTAT